MGGGGAMRAAAKIAGIGAAASRGIHPFPSSETRVATAARNSNRPVVSSLTTSVDEQAIDDWELAGGGEDMFQVSGAANKRLVFGTVPTLQEAQAATSQLKDAFESSLMSDIESGSHKQSSSEHSVTKACLTSSGNTLGPILPKQATQALIFLNQSPAVQNVVASIASDPNVWGAVMQNPELVGYLNSYNADVGSLWEEAEIVVDESSESVSKNWFSESCNSIKVAVGEMIKNLSGFFQSLFGGSEKAKGADMIMGGSFLGLAVIVMMIIVLKRG
jgi:hypothetical protein